MSMLAEVNFWAEGPTDRALARRLIREAGGRPGADYAQRRGASPGKDYLDKRLRAFNSAARFGPWLILRDGDAECPVELSARLIQNPSRWMRLRIVVPMVEAWLIADREALAGFLGVAVANIPVEPELIRRPKAAILELANRSRKRDIKADFLPWRHSGRVEGAGYASRLIEFIGEGWCPERAALAAPSLGRAIESLKDLIETWTEEHDQG